MTTNALFYCLLLTAPPCHQRQEEPLLAASASVNTPELPIAPDSAADSLLLDVQSLDSTIRVDVRYAGSNNFTGAALPGYDAPRALLRREAAQALVRVQRRLRKQGLSLLVFDGYRPVRATMAMVRWADRTGHRALLTDGYIASRSRHNLGLAVDLTIVDAESGSAIDMGTPFDTFSELAHTAHAEGRVLANRRILVRAMEAEGFRNYEKEWWHFSFDVPGALPFDRVIR
jgi:zinc D-Ala-D-Ala dipeptidase